MGENDAMKLWGIKWNLSDVRIVNVGIGSML